MNVHTDVINITLNNKEAHEVAEALRQFLRHEVASSTSTNYEDFLAENFAIYKLCVNLFTMHYGHDASDIVINSIKSSFGELAREKLSESEK